MLDRIFLVINNKLNRNAEKFNWPCSKGLIRIKAGRIPTYKTTCFKDVKVLLDGVRGVNCNGLKKYYIDVHFAKKKCYYLKIVVVFRKIINQIIKEKNETGKF